MAKIVIEQIINCDGMFCGKCDYVLQSIASVYDSDPDKVFCRRFDRLRLQRDVVGGTFSLLRCKSCLEAEVKE